MALQAFHDSAAAALDIRAQRLHIQFAGRHRAPARRRRIIRERSHGHQTNQR
jgi:hypothetical protein